MRGAVIEIDLFLLYMNFLNSFELLAASISTG